MRNYYIIISLALFALGCTDKKDSELIPTLEEAKALFTPNRVYATIYDTVFFTNQSTGDSLSFEWDFGDGSTSTDKNPYYQYAGLGEYVVTLTATNLEDANTYLSDTIYVKYLVDFEGNEYKTVIVGDLEWMAQNMRSTFTTEGIPIPLVEEGKAWDDLHLETGFAAAGYCHFKNVPDWENGVLYNFEAATRLCINGWRMPTENDFNNLTDFIFSENMDDIVSNNSSDRYFKSTTEWCSRNGTDDYGLSIEPTGYRGTYLGDWASNYEKCAHTKLWSRSMYNYENTGNWEYFGNNQCFHVSDVAYDPYLHNLHSGNGISLRLVRDVE